ncbi:FHA domain-containing protein [Aliikangiella coralliicola]|uniref:FHA domain-containing protein n=1 Tax=Aliikangiella coralliicola TaxID=2592383 RepID=A0A545U056_9GAMM|nr:FHA domain-containing protein [Aliikangiella coralliicola]TQV82813.1 FHA domain-containing protein [Aliikangiella coralliicola]
MAVLVQLLDGNVLNKFNITEAGLSIGRSINNNIYLDDLSVSQKHAKIEQKQLTDGAYVCFIHDLESTNHTFVNNQKVTTHLLSDQDVIVIGTQNFKFIDEENEKLAQTKAFKKSWIPGMYYLED